jgi:hypothetical protein
MFGIGSNYCSVTSAPYTDESRLQTLLATWATQDLLDRATSDERYAATSKAPVLYCMSLTTMQTMPRID